MTHSPRTLPGQNRSEGHPSRRALELAAFDESAADPHIKECEGCQALVQQLQLERDSFLKARPARPFFARLDEKASTRGRFELRGWKLPAFGLTAALAMSLLLLLRGPSTKEEDVRFKGGEARMELWVSRDAQPAVPLEPSDALRPGDRIKLSVTLPRPGFLFLANLDATGKLTRYYPTLEAGSLSVAAGRTVLPGTIELDGYVGRELLLLVYSSEPWAESTLFRAFTEHFQNSGGTLEAFNALTLRNSQLMIRPIEKVAE